MATNARMIRVIEHFQYTIQQIPANIPENGHKKISRITSIFWLVHLSLTACIFYLIAAEDIEKVWANCLVVLQLMITKVFESMNRLYDNSLTVQSNAADITDIILTLIKDYYNVFEPQNYSDADCERCVESISVLDHQIRDDLDIYSKNMRAWKIIVNSFFWKSPDHTPLLVDKDAIKNRLLRIILQMKSVRQKRDGVADSSPENYSITAMRF